MNRRPSTLIPRPPVRHVWRSAARSDALMLAEVRDYADRGTVVCVLRPDGDTFQVIRNGERYLVRTADGAPLATVDTVLEAVMAGDAHLDHRGEDDFDDEPRGAA